MRWSVGLIFICIASAEPGASLQRVYIWDLATDRPVVDLAVTVRHDKVTTKLTTGKGGMLELPTGTNLQITSDDPAWRILPAKVHVDEDLVEIAAHRYITVSGRVSGTVGGDDIKHIEDANIFATFVDAAGKNANVGSGGPLVVPLGLRTLWRAGIPNTKGEFRLRVPMIPGVAIFARHDVQFASVQRLNLKAQVKMDLSLQKALVFAGVVVDEKGEPIHRAFIRAVTIVGGRNGWLPKREINRRCAGTGSRQSFQGDGWLLSWHWLYSRTLKDGRFRLSTATDGDYRIIVSAEGFVPYRPAVFRLKTSSVEERIVLKRATGLPPVELTIDGTRHPGISVQLSELLPRDPGTGFSGGMDVWQVRLDDKGQIPGQWLRKGSWYIISLPDHPGTSLSFDWPANKPLRLRSGKKPTVDVKVEVK